MALQVREAVAVLDLEVLYRPCPANGPTWRAKVREMGGKASFPFMHDPNTGGPRDCSSPMEVAQSMLPYQVISWLQSRALEQLSEQWVRRQAGRQSSQAAQTLRPAGVF